MVNCTFFGHRECPPEIAERLEAVLIKLIRDQKVCRFLVGDSGQYDALCRKVLKKLRATHPQIFYFVVLSRLPTGSSPQEDHEVTILPEEIETAPHRFAVEHRNRWLLRQSDIVVCYVKHPFGGAHKFVQLAKKQGKTVINLAET